MSSSASPQPSTDALRTALAQARDELVACTRRAYGGFVALRRYSGAIDGLLTQIGRSAHAQTNTPHALIAIGGYGRRHMCLHSDVDLLLVFDGSIGSAEERAIKAVLHPLWDLRLDVGHHVREMADTATIDTDNPEYLVALCTARFVAGDATVFERFSDVCLAADSPWKDAAVEAIRDLTKRRYQQFQDTLYQLEPDIKDAPGALRDVTATRLLDQLTERNQRLEFQAGRLDEAEDFMLRIRSILHLERGRNLNVLTHELQETVASVFGSPEQTSRTQVESLMSTYFHHARIIGRALDAALKSVAPSPAGDATPIGDGLLRRGQEIWFADGTRASLQPETWLRAFDVAIEEHCAVSDQVLTCIERHGDRYAPERFFPTASERDRLLRLLRPRPGLYGRLSEMHASGLLGRMFPEFQKVYCHVIRDFYHKFTVDEHTLLTIRNVESLCDPATRSRRRFGGLLQEVERPELLVLALLFHDVGKWTNKNHCEEGVRMAEGALRRIKVSEADIAVVTFLIRHHLQMSVAAFRRDTDDPDVVKQFARLVGTEERLKLLCLLTLADVAAVGPDVMTPWKEDLLWRLYVDAYNQLTLGYGDDIIDVVGSNLETLVEGRPPDIEAAELELFLKGFPQRYLRSVDAEHVYAHLRLARDLQPADVHCVLNHSNAIWELAVVSADRPKLYAKICGVLSYFGMDILRGQAMTNAQGVALDVFQFTDADEFLGRNPSGTEELTHRLEEVVAEREDIDRMLAPKQRGMSRRRALGVKLVVHLDNDYSGRFTILEIVAANAWGLLYRISRVISRHDCDIELVLASTEGNRAIDVFHLTKDGMKLASRDAEVLQRDLEAALTTPEPS